MFDFDGSSPETVEAWFRRALVSGFRGDIDAGYALEQVWDAQPADRPVILAAVQAMLASGGDDVRSELLGFLRGYGPADVIRDLVLHLPAWAEHTNPQERPHKLGLRIVRAALSDFNRRAPDVQAAVAPLIARYGAHEEWLLLWLDIEPAGRGLKLLAEHMAAKREMKPHAIVAGIIYATKARDSLLAATDILAGADLAARGWFLAEVDKHLPASELALRQQVRARLGF